MIETLTLFIHPCLVVQYRWATVYTQTRQADRQTYRRTDREAGRQIDWLTLPSMHTYSYKQNLPSYSGMACSFFRKTCMLKWAIVGMETVILLMEVKLLAWGMYWHGGLQCVGYRNRNQKVAEVSYIYPLEIKIVIVINSPVCAVVHLLVNLFQY